MAMSVPILAIIFALHLIAFVFTVGAERRRSFVPTLTLTLILALALTLTLTLTLTCETVIFCCFNLTSGFY